MINPPYNDITLHQLSSQHPQLFHNHSPHTFPLLTKLLDPNHKLSLQLHPHHHYALKHQPELPKTQSSYILHPAPPPQIIYPLHPHNKHTLIHIIHN
ncbi:type I phosphomannose isomerase catalytic subunit, partial [Staphylococcus aureus]|uniref:type I phosphomannose isomerase catalytic subunit n=1 Tax=Staphylococcus aureus TaxID=1280 RepID=UPI0037DA6A1C